MHSLLGCGHRRPPLRALHSVKLIAASKETPQTARVLPAKAGPAEEGSGAGGA